MLRCLGHQKSIRFNNTTVANMAVLLSLFCTLIQSVTAFPYDAEANSTLRAEFYELAPLLSMDGELTLELMNAEKVSDSLLRIHELSKKEFSSNPRLKSVGKAHIDYLMGIETRIIPVLRAQLLDSDELLLELFSRVIENQVLNQWQLEFDRQCQSGYTSIMIVARSVSAKPTPLTDPSKPRFELQCNHEFTIQHFLPHTLNGVTIAVQFSTFTGEESAAYYFIPQWAANRQYILRIPAEWRHIGASATTSISYEILSEEVSTFENDWALTQNFEQARSVAFQNALASVDTMPHRTLQILSQLSRINVADTKEQKKSIEELRARAKKILRSMIPRWNMQLRSTERDERLLQKQLKDQKLPQHTRTVVLSRLESISRQKEMLADLLRDARRIR